MNAIGITLSKGQVAFNKFPAVLVGLGNTMLSTLLCYISLLDQQAQLVILVALHFLNLL